MRSTKFLVHDENNRTSALTCLPSHVASLIDFVGYVPPLSELRMEDSVMIRNCPPISAHKRFTLEKVLNSPETERELAHAQQAAEAAGSSIPPSSPLPSAQPTL
ncbi:hypothetical protein EW146_g5636 [Bondarzewia mesenterica]|uniref:Uncharacterized protein n=1 Tax=Bondarzewia mesenterica TaxID=1095465 RepID=A0A4S4LWL3_9AGAM|nr:hypothetical protein EW146_g5636 [Bondarzewia mesenterica]